MWTFKTKKGTYLCYWLEPTKKELLAQFKYLHGYPTAYKDKDLTPVKVKLVEVGKNG